MEEEVWKALPDFEGLYEASNLGRIRSVIIKGTGIGYGATRNGDILKPFRYNKSENYCSYRYSLCKNGIHKNFMAHILVARTFPEICGEWFEGAVVHHIDFNPTNNKADNLKVMTKDEHILIHRLNGRNVGEKNPFYGKHHTANTIRKTVKKLRKPIYQYDLLGNCICYWFSCTDCERETGMNKGCINKCCMGKQKQAYNYIWRYAKEGD